MACPLAGTTPDVGAFAFPPAPGNSYLSASRGRRESFLPVIRLQGFSWYDFASFDNSSSAKLGQWGKSIRQKKEHVFATSRCSSWRRPERYIGGGSVCGSKNDKQVLVVQRTTVLDGPERSGDRPRNKIREGASLEEQVRSASCPSLADTLVSLFKPCRTRNLRQNHTAKILATE